MNCDDAVLVFPNGSAMLPLNARSFVSLLYEARFINDPDVHRPRMFTGNDPLKLITHRGMIPIIRGQELLQCARRDPSV